VGDSVHDSLRAVHPQFNSAEAAHGTAGH